MGCIGDDFGAAGVAGGDGGVGGTGGGAARVGSEGLGLRDSSGDPASQRLAHMRLKQGKWIGNWQAGPLIHTLAAVGRNQWIGFTLLVVFWLPSVVLGGQPLTSGFGGSVERGTPSASIGAATPGILLPYLPSREIAEGPPVVLGETRGMAGGAVTLALPPLAFAIGAAHRGYVRVDLVGWHVTIRAVGFPRAPC